MTIEELELLLADEEDKTLRVVLYADHGQQLMFADGTDTTRVSGDYLLDENDSVFETPNAFIISAG